VLLGVLSASLEYTVSDWLEVIEQLVPKRAREINAGAFAAGRAWAEAARLDPALRYDSRIARYSAPGAQPDIQVTLEINSAWCKGCDICVKLCPERCLALNAEQVAVLKNPDACTGCHVCEWLCPDFAISVTAHVREPAVA
jgi:indolepyruvate ferredoxin oxidoreductase beta subunit